MVFGLISRQMFSMQQSTHGKRVAPRHVVALFTARALAHAAAHSKHSIKQLQIRMQLQTVKTTSKTRVSEVLRVFYHWNGHSQVIRVFTSKLLLYICTLTDT